MIDETSKVQETLDQLNEFAKRGKVFLLNDIPSEEPLPEVDVTKSMDFEAFLTLAKSLDCQILYYQKREFLLDDEWGGYFKTLNKEDEEKWEKRIKQPLAMKVLFYYNGVSHRYEVEEAWLKEYKEWAESTRNSKDHRNEDFFQKQKRMFKQNKQRWCTVLAYDRKFQSAKSFTLRATIALTLLPEIKDYGQVLTLKVRGCNSEFTRLIDDSMKIVEGLLRNQRQVYNSEDHGKFERFISATLYILEICKNTVRRILSKIPPIKTNRRVAKTYHEAWKYRVAPRRKQS